MAETRVELLGEIYDLMVQQHTPDQQKRLPPKESFIEANLKDFKVGGRTFKKASMKDLQNRKRELMSKLGSKSKPAKQSVLKKNKPKKDGKPKATTSTPKKPTYTVGGKTFATLKEAKAFKSLYKPKNYDIKEGGKKVTHKVVSFTAKTR